MNARDYALFELDRRHLPRWPANLLRMKDPAPPADPRDYALAEQITTGVIQNLRLLQHLIEHHARRPLAKVDPLVQKVLTVALYQIRFLTRIPPRAAVDEAVEQTKRLGRRSAAGFVNAVLRNALRSPDVPLPDPDTDPESHAELALSHPRDLFRQLTQVLLPDQALALCRQHNAPPPTILRLAATVTLDQLRAPDPHSEARDPQFELTPHQTPGMVVIAGAKQSTLAELATRGLAQVQDPTAAGVVDYLDLAAGQTVLDRCAGLGTKTLQICDRVGPAGKILAVDPNLSRCQRLARVLSERGIDNVHIEPVAMLEQVRSPLPGHFDRILVDAPCSNSGVLARRPEARYHQDARTLASLRSLQLDILADTAPRLARGGRLVYSTCSIWPEENQSVVAAFLANHPQFTLRSEHATLPSIADSPASWHDGGYVAVLQRID